MSRSLRVVSYNIHRGYGTDGRYDPDRIRRVLAEVDADVIGLQEVDTTLIVPSRERRRPQTLPHPEEGEANGHRTVLQYLADSLHMQFVEGYINHRRWGLFGNAILTRFPLQDVKRIDLTVRGASERRGALDVGMEVHGVNVRVLVAHLGLQVWERHFQISRLLKTLGEDKNSFVVMMGDFNLWLSTLPRLRRFYSRLGHAPLVRTFPSFFPILALDRIWTQPASALNTVRAHRTPLSRKASDHLPLVSTLSF